MLDNESYSIVSDYLGTPTHAYGSDGSLAWERELDIYGRPRKGDNEFIPFLYQGQYFDKETGLAYNRFRYYDPSTGSYISQDPIRLEGGMNIYSYVHNTNLGLDIFGLAAANGGIAPGHGGNGHNKVIDTEVARLQSDPSVTNIRKNQQQVNVNGNTVGTNRPDIQYDQNGVHHNVEYDTTVRGSTRHQNQIPKNDPSSRNTFWQIDNNGNLITGHSQIPQSQPVKSSVIANNTNNNQQNSRINGVGGH